MTEFNKPFPELKIKKSKAAAARILLKSLTYSFALFGLLFILLLVVLANMLGSPSVMVHPVPSRAVLTLDLDRRIRKAAAMICWRSSAKSRRFLFMI